MRRRTAITITAATVTVAAVTGGLIWLGHDPAAPTPEANHDDASADLPEGQATPEEGQELEEWEVEEGVEVVWYEEHTAPPADEQVTDVDTGDVLDTDPGTLPDGYAAYPLEEDQWLVLDTTQPLPEEVTTQLDQRAAELPLPPVELGTQESIDAAVAQEQFAQDVADSTGRWPILIYPRGDQWEAWFMVEDNSFTASAATQEAAQTQARYLADEHADLGLFLPEVVLSEPVTHTY